MRIAVNCQLLVKDKMEGLGWFAYETLRRIAKSHPEHEFTFIFGKGIDDEFIFANNVKAVNIGPPFFRPIVWWLKFGFLLPRYINRNHFDVFLSPDGWSSPRIKTKTVIVVHDINFVHFPQFLKKSFHLYYSHFFPRWIRHAQRLATVSNYSKQDIVKSYGVNPDKIEVMYNGASTLFRPISDNDKRETKKKYTEGCNYFVFVGALHPRKNVVNLLKAFDLFKQNDNSGLKLVIVGERFYWNKETSDAYENMAYKGEVIFTGRCTQHDLVLVMGAAMALVYVSLFEGFGIPLVEAMCCGVPIITSNTTSMPEVAENAALLVDPYSVADIAAAMQRLVADEHLRHQLIEAGHRRKLDFSWDKTAQQLWTLVESVLQTD